MNPNQSRRGGVGDNGIDDLSMYSDFADEDLYGNRNGNLYPNNVALGSNPYNPYGGNSYAPGYGRSTYDLGNTERSVECTTCARIG